MATVIPVRKPALNPGGAATLAALTKTQGAHGARLDGHDGRLDSHDDRLGGHEAALTDHGDRITALEKCAAMAGQATDGDGDGDGGSPSS